MVFCRRKALHVDVWDGPGQMGFGLGKFGCGFLGRDLTPDELTERPMFPGLLHRMQPSDLVGCVVSQIVGLFMHQCKKDSHPPCPKTPTKDPIVRQTHKLYLVL